MPDEYQRICDRIARKAIRYAKEMAKKQDLASYSADCPKCEAYVGQLCVFTTTGQDAPANFVHNERAVASVGKQTERWLAFYLDEHLPDIDADALLEATSRGKAFEKSTGRPAPSRAVAAFHALQADVRDAIRRQEAGDA